MIESKLWGNFMTDEDDIIKRITNILERHDTVPQSLRDELILLGLLSLLNKLQDYNERLKFLEKYKPYLVGLAWATGIVASSLLLMAISGKLQIMVTP